MNYSKSIIQHSLISSSYFFLFVTVSALTSCSTTQNTGSNKLFDSYHNCGVGSTWRYEGTLATRSRYTGDPVNFEAHSTWMKSSKRTGKILIERTLTNIGEDGLKFNIRAWLNGHPVASFHQTHIGEGLYMTPSLSQYIPAKTNPRAGGIYDGGYLQAQPSRTIKTHDGVCNNYYVVKNSSDHYSINGKTYLVSSVSRFVEIFQKEKSLSSTLWVCDEIPSRVTRFRDNHSTYSNVDIDLTLTSYKIAPVQKPE